MKRKYAAGVVLAVLLVMMLSRFTVQPSMASLPVHNINTCLDYATIQEAVDAPETLDGHTILVDAGTYCECITIHKSISLIGENRSTTIIDGNLTGNVITIATNNVSINGFTIQKSGGAHYPSCGICVVEQNAGNNISCNIIANNSHGIWTSHSSYNTILTNTIRNNEAAITILGGSDNNMSRNIITNNGDGIFLDASDNTISENNVTDNGRGIGLKWCSGNTIRGNNVTNNDSGIQLSAGYYNNIYGNNITDNGEGIMLSCGPLASGSRYNTICENNITDNDIGVKLFSYSNYNNVTDNNIVENRIGVSLYASSNNSIFHNNFHNTNQVYIHPEFPEYPSTNIWDDGCEGNHWSNYNPPDKDLDQTGDVAYVVDENNTDRYPLIYPRGFVPSPDVNRDGTVDMTDMKTEAAAFTTKPGDQNWNPLVDMDINEVINIIDIAKVAREYGKAA